MLKGFGEKTYIQYTIHNIQHTVYSIQYTAYNLEDLDIYGKIILKCFLNK